MIDLHCHSRFSDGSDPPEAIVAKAGAIGLRAVALTDHDTLEGLDPFLGMQGATPVRLVPGIELSCEFAGRDLPVLGLFVDHRDPLFRGRVERLQARRLKRNEQVLENLRGMKIDLRSRGLWDREGEGPTTRGHIADMLVAGGYAADRQDAFRKYVGEDAPAYAPFDYLSPADAFSWIREAGGLPAIAHPGRFANGAFVWDRAMADFRDMGALGVETYYSEHSPAQTAYFLGLCQDLSMAPTGGSDYHGAMKPWCEMGTGRGGLAVPDSVLEGLEAALRERGIWRAQGRARGYSNSPRHYSKFPLN
jgi:predicted metal-dependent phosphoesterase TrpH